ncbi:fructose-bisphosphate aldolase [Aspergillus nomiae NRRL 13137]|uniref:Fructose-bisphosphate aldolase n=1 Tax=Aspergillus nomiae NRRL (strain ATCC 15546 / NRRL 13137 / CBS 260.88 / M93) TaxID=1509407 RepID=A0A0L1J645_ASPN3|nr:fructose-bisphosphate aldolase [Aspergillus nomiae NRRL 13137]KNG87209.1 fructose-bisphosphate aldolase [Aspergillus nomiae NRRL 13137]
MVNPSITSNRTRSILQAAKEGKYAVGAYNCYNCDGVMAVIRAAEAKRSPAIIQLFPWTLHFQGPEFVCYVVNSAHAASVPIAVHLDHCIKPEDVELALTLPFDSIMIDGSTMEEAENVAICARNIKRAHELGISIEVEMGRIEGGEDGLPKVDLGTVFTNPEDARQFMEETGADFLAPSFGNIHGGYGPGGAEKSWDTSLLRKISKSVEQPLVLHGTHPVTDELFLKAIDCGVSKINVNRTVRDDYTKFVAENAGKLELTVLKVQAVDVYAKSVQRVMDLFRSSGKA